MWMCACARQLLLPRGALVYGYGVLTGHGPPATRHPFFPFLPDGPATPASACLLCLC